MRNAPECQDEIVRKEDERRRLAFSCLEGIGSDIYPEDHRFYQTYNNRQGMWKETFYKTKTL